MYRVNNCHYLIKSFRISFYVVALILCLSSLFHFAKPNEQKTKLCADPKCKDDLFPSNFIRIFDSSDQTFLKTKINAPVKVVAFKFSDRPDLLEAEDDEGKRGFIFESYIDQMPYVIFLEAALKRNQTLYMVDRMGDWPKVIKEVSAFPELYLMYITYAAKLENYTLDKNIVAKKAQYEQSQQVKAQRHNHHQNVQQQQQRNSNAELLNVKSDQNLVDDTAKNEGNKNKSKDGMQREDTEKAMEQQKDETNQNPNGELRAEKEAISEQQHNLPNPEKEAISEQQHNLPNLSYPKTNNAETTDHTPAEVNKQQTEDRQPNVQSPVAIEKPHHQEIPSPSHNPPKLIQNSLPNTQTSQTLQQQNPTSQSQTNHPQTQQTVEIEKVVPHREEIQQSSHNLQQKPELVQELPSKTQPDQAMQQQTPPSVHSEKLEPHLPKVPSPLQNSQPDESVKNLPAENQPEQKFQPQNPTQSKQQTPSPSIQIEPNPSANKQLESISTQTEQSQFPQKTQQQVPPLQSQSNPSHENIPISPEQKVPSLHSSLQNPLPQQTEPQTKSTESTDDNSPNQHIRVQTPQHQHHIGTNHVEKVEEGNAGETNKKLEEALPTGKSDDLRQIKVTDESRNQPQERSSPISGDAVFAHKSIETGTPTDESFTAQQIEIEKSAETLKGGGVFDATRNENDLQKEKNIVETEQQGQQQKYCFKEECHELDKPFSNSEHLQQQQSLSSPIPSALKRMFSEWMASVRAVLPEPLCHFEDTGLIVLAFVITAVVLHLVNLLLFSNSGPEPFNHRLLHDCITRLKEQELIIEKANKNAVINQNLAEAAKTAEHLQKHNETLEESLKSVEKRALELETENGKFKQFLKKTGHELEQSQLLVSEFRTSMETKDAELKKLNSAQQKIEIELNDALGKLAQSQNKEKYLEQDLKEAHLELERIKLELSEAQKEAAAKRSECAEKAAEIDELLGVIAELNKDKIGGKGKSKEKEEGRRKSQQKTAPVDKQNVENHSGSSAASSPGQTTSLLEAVEMDPDNGAGSGGSAGWSDLGDGMEIPGADSEPTGGKLLDILELAKLKSRLRSLETDRDQTKLTMKIAQDEKEHLTKEVERLRHELVERERDSEQRELDRHGLTQQCTKLLQMIEEKEKKMDYGEQEREKLRTRLSDAELGLLRVEDEKRELQHRIKELEQSFKQSNELNGRLENKFYHEERRLNTKIRQLDEQLAIAKSSLNMSGGGVSADLNMSANSSDQGFIPLSSPDGGGPRGRSGVTSLWSEIDTSEPVEELVSLERRDLRRRSIRSGNAAGEVSRDSPFLNDIVHVNKLGREERLNSSKFSSGASVRSANVPRQRMRSRSAGRQSVARLTGIRPNLYGAVDPSFHPATLTQHRASAVPYQSSNGKNSPFRQQERPQSAARLKSTVYSSDSNGASSPPPEMPILSGVPPPRLSKRPTVFIPASKPNVQIHNPVPK